MLLFGFLAYLLAGLGLGGAALLLPLLSRFTEISAARADAMIAYLPAALAASVVHGIKGKRPNDKMMRLLPLGLVGAVIGGLIAGHLSTGILRVSYGVFLLVYGIKMLFSVKRINEICKKWKFSSKIMKIFCKFFNFS